LPLLGRACFFPHVSVTRYSADTNVPSSPIHHSALHYPSPPSGAYRAQPTAGRIKISTTQRVSLPAGVEVGACDKTFFGSSARRGLIRCSSPRPPASESLVTYQQLRGCHPSHSTTPRMGGLSCAGLVIGGSDAHATPGGGFVLSSEAHTLADVTRHASSRFQHNTRGAGGVAWSGAACGITNINRKA